MQKNQLGSGCRSWCGRNCLRDNLKCLLTSACTCQRVKLLAHFFAWSNAEGNIYLFSTISDVITTSTSMISNYDLTEMCELLISMWTALVLVTKTVLSMKALVLSVFWLVGIPWLSQNWYVETRLAVVLVTNRNEVTARNWPWKKLCETVFIRRSSWVFFRCGGTEGRENNLSYTKVSDVTIYLWYSACTE